MAGKQPDYMLSAFNKRTEAKGNVGAAWIGEGDRISIRLNALTVLTSDPDWVLTLWPANTSRGQRASPPRAARVQVIEDDPDDDIPF